MTYIAVAPTADIVQVLSSGVSWGVGVCWGLMALTAFAFITWFVIQSL